MSANTLVQRPRGDSCSSSLSVDSLSEDTLGEEGRSVARKIKKTPLHKRVFLTRKIQRNIYKCRYKNKRTCIVKHIPADESKIKSSSERKKTIYGLLKNCPSIIRISIYCEEDSGDLFALMPLLKYGDMFKILLKSRTLSERRTRMFSRQLLEAVSFLHKKGIVHRDIKLENIFYHKKTDSIKLADFDLACMPEIDPIDIVSIACGTSAYISPQVIEHSIAFTHTQTMQHFVHAVEKNEPYPWCWYKNDVWACGLVVYIMLHGFHPFTDFSNDSCIAIAYDIHQNAPAGIPIMRRTTMDCQTTIHLLLSYEESDRIDAASALLLPWFAED